MKALADKDPDTMVALSAQASEREVDTRAEVEES